jgi:DNA-directed RNA polymerase I subunit RPA49
VAVYDPISDSLDIAEARKMTVRGTIRQAGPTEADEAEAPIEPTSNYSSRNALTHTFGTKKSKKLVQSRAQNVLYSRDADPAAANPLSEALLSSMPKAEALPTTSDGKILDAAAAIQAAKPLPIPDLTTTDVSQAYPLSSLVFPSPFSSTLNAMPTSDWRTTLSEGKGIPSSSRFIANRVAHVTYFANTDPTPTSPQTTTLQLLRYIYLLIELARALQKFRPGKPVPPAASWPSVRITDQASLPAPLLSGLIKKYCPTRTTTKSDMILLHTTILALTLHIPPPSGQHVAGMLSTEPTDIQQDLNLSAEDARRYWRELGCKLEFGTDAEFTTWGMPKPGPLGLKTKYAKLRLPLVFPRIGRGPSSRRR